MANILKIEPVPRIFSFLMEATPVIFASVLFTSDRSGSGNTANIGSINNIADIKAGRGMFSKLGGKWFDEYWMNYNKITIQDGKGGTKKISTLREFVEYKKGDISLVIDKRKEWV